MTRSGAEGPIRILYVEDDEDDYLLTRELLLDTGDEWMELKHVATYDDALVECSRAENFDLCLIDYRLGARTGIELLHALESRGRPLPVIVLTGNAAPEVDLEAMRAGAVDYLVKGEFTAAQLERAVRYATDVDRTWREIEGALRRLADGRELERLRLAQELHDGPLQDLYGSLFQLGSLADVMPDVNRAKRLLEAMSILQGVGVQLRTICGELRPPALTPFGLEVAIRSLVEGIRAANPGLVIDLDLDADGQQLPERTRLALYRICQQALTNVVQHASATNVVVRLSLEPEAVTLEVHDDGVGFTVPERWVHISRDGHLGLLGARERADAVGGWLSIRSGPSEGTTLDVVVPRSGATGESGPGAMAAAVLADS